jgi:alpha-glucosidase
MGGRENMTAESTPWWRDAVFYQIYPRSFADSNGDGVGDIDGIRAHLAALVWLGIDVLWISPFYRSPMADFGYDVSDYCEVDPIFGDLAAFDLTAPAWSVHPETGEWYLHLFDPAQPDLNWDEPAVVEAMHDVLRFWLDRGVDGFRADVLHTIGKFPDLPDDPPAVAGVPHCALNDVPVTHERIRSIRALIDSYPDERVLVGEIYLMTTEAIAAYYGEGDEVHMAFNFPAIVRRLQW